MRNRLTWRCLQVAVVMIVAIPTAAYAQCRPGWVLIGEDENYWYCASPASTTDLSEVTETYAKQRPELWGTQWRYRKAVIEAAASLARDSMEYRNGGKLRLSHDGRVVYICVSSQCAGDPTIGIDCSGLLEESTRHAACLVSGFYSTILHTLKGLESDAAGQARFFQQHGAFLSPSDSPNPGDAVFFRDTVRHRKGITHVEIFLGTRRDGKALILHASSVANRVLFTTMSDDLLHKIAGYGNVSRLYLALE